MKAVGWTTWARYMPSTSPQSRTGAATLCLKPWDQILPDEGIEEKMAGAKVHWNAWERCLLLEKADSMHLLTELKLEEMKQALV